MRGSKPTEPETDPVTALRSLWTEATGKVFKLTSKSYAFRDVTYTQVKGVKPSKVPGEFDVEVVVVEFTARVAYSRRNHSSVCKEGVLHQAEGCYLPPDSFGVECRLQEFEQVATAVLAHATTHLDGAMLAESDEEADVSIPLDLPHLTLTDMEASLVQDSPFLAKNNYFLSATSRQAALDLIKQDLERATRNSRLNDVCDPVYLEQKRDAIASLRQKLARALPPEPVRSSAPAPRNAAASEPEPATARGRAERAGARKGAPAGRRLSLGLLALDSITLALLGHPSAATLSWTTLNPSHEGPVFRIDQEYGLLEFVRWAHVSGHTVADDDAAGKSLRSHFRGPGGGYTGPDRAGIYPLMKPEA